MDNKTPQLMDEEIRQQKERQEKVARIALKFEAMLLAEDASMGDFLEAVAILNERSNRVFENIKIKKIKDDYGR